jgi:sulfur-oxidizing protein SoxZ
MARPIKIRAKSKNGIVTCKVLMSHKMETGLRKNKKTGKLIPAHHITEITAVYEGTTVLEAQVGGAVSKNPYLSFKFKGEKGKKMTFSFTDNKGKSESTEEKIK